MADEKGYTIPIYINPVERGGASNGSGGDAEYSLMQPSEIGEDGQKNQQKAVAKSKSNANAAKALVTQIAGKVASTALNNYGNITGDYIAQQNMQTTISEVTQFASAVALGPVGIAMYGVGKLFDAYNYISQIKRSQTQAAFKQQRVYAESKKS